MAGLLLAVLAGGLTYVAIGASATHDSGSFTEDAQGIDDEPGQKDLTGYAVDETTHLTDIGVAFALDETSTSGNNSLDACILLDAGDDGLADYSVCYSEVFSGANQGVSYIVYSCGNGRADRCTQPLDDITGDGTITPSCTVATDDAIFDEVNDPDAKDTADDDRVVTCLLSFGLPGSLDLTDVCSYPSGQPNSDPSDCVITSTGNQPDPILTLVKTVDNTGGGAALADAWTLSATSPQQIVSGVTGTAAVTSVVVQPGDYTLAEAGGPIDYTLSSLACAGKPNTASVATPNISLASGDTVTCTFTNSFVPAPSSTLVKSLGSDANGDGNDEVDDLIEYSIVFTNTGNVTLDAVVIADADLDGLTCDPAGASSIPGVSVAPDATVTCSGTHQITQDDVDAGQDCNIASVTIGTAAPVQSNEVCQPITRSPAIDIDKTAGNGVDDSQSLVAGGTATFQITVTNTGNVTLTGVAVTDALAPLCATLAPVTLAPGASISAYTCELADVQSSFINSATATGSPPAGDDVSDTDTSDVVLVSPGLSVTKSADAPVVVVDGDDTSVEVTFTILVANAGDTSIADIVVSDPDADSIDCDAGTDGDQSTIASLGVGESTSCKATMTVDVGADGVWDQATNTATACGDPAIGPEVCDDGEADQDFAGIVIVKTESGGASDSQTVVSGGTASFDMVVTNIGSVALSGVTVVDALSPDCDRGPLGAPLPAGGSTSYSCSQSGVTEGFTNSATATGTPPGEGDDRCVGYGHVGGVGGGVVGHQERCTLDDGDDGVATPGDVIGYEITVTNVGDVALVVVGGRCAGFGSGLQR